MKKQIKPRLISITDIRGDDLTPPRLVREMLDADAQMFPRVNAFVKAGTRPAQTVQEDLQAVRRRPLDAPMATAWEEKSYQSHNDTTGESVVWLGLLIVIAAFCSGIIVGIWI